MRGNLLCRRGSSPEISPVWLAGGVMYSWISGNTWTSTCRPKYVWTWTYMEDSQKTRACSNDKSCLVSFYRFISRHTNFTNWMKLTTIPPNVITRLMDFSDLLLSNFDHVVWECKHFLKIHETSGEITFLYCTTCLLVNSFRYKCIWFHCIRLLVPEKAEE